jgi:aspartate aminotransferase-like enzyme
LNVFISELNRRLQAIAEVGCQRGLQAHKEWFEQSRQEIHDSGLTCFAKILSALGTTAQVEPSIIL